MTDRVGEQFGNYRLKQLLGTGGFAEVWLAESEPVGEMVAIKILHSKLLGEYQEQFLREARILAGLDNPHIVPLLGFGRLPDPYLVMSYASNGTLRNRCPIGKSLPLKDVLLYIRQTGEALQYAHARKIMHLDVKPQNLLFNKEGQLMLADFGISAIVQSRVASSSNKQRIGTAVYMAPEQCLGKPGFASDQYALAIMTYELLCGMPPFRGNELALMYQHVNESPLPLCDRLHNFPVLVSDVIMRALAKRPEDRFMSVAEFIEKLIETYSLFPQDTTAPQAHQSLAGNIGSDTTTIIAAPGVPTQALSYSTGETLQISVQVSAGPTSGIVAQNKGGMPKKAALPWRTTIIQNAVNVLGRLKVLGKKVYLLACHVKGDAVVDVIVGSVGIALIMAYVYPTETSSTNGMTAGFVAGIVGASATYLVACMLMALDSELVEHPIKTRAIAIFVALLTGQLIGVAVGMFINGGIWSSLFSFLGLAFLYVVVAGLVASRR